MKLYKALILCYLAAVAINIAAGQGSNNGNDNGQYNVGEHALRLIPAIAIVALSNNLDRQMIKVS